MSTAELLERRGLERGRAEGRQEGMTRGSYQRAIESARKMLAANEPIDKISLYTSLTLEQVEKLTF